MRKVARKNIIMDRLHKGFVVGCIVVTLYGLSSLGQRWYRYFTVLRPQQKQRELLAKQELLAEGSSDKLKDNAADLTT